MTTTDPEKALSLKTEELNRNMSILQNRAQELRGKGDKLRLEDKDLLGALDFAHEKLCAELKKLNDELTFLIIRDHFDNIEE